MPAATRRTASRAGCLPLSSPALTEAIQRGVPIGGTSTGLAVQGEFIYSAQGDAPDEADLKSDQTLVNPFPPAAAPYRMGRTLVFMARILQDRRAQPIRDIAVDERTSVLLEPDGQATVAGAGRAFFLPSIRAPEVG